MYIRSRKKLNRKKNISYTKYKINNNSFCREFKTRLQCWKRPLLHKGKDECILLCLVLKIIANQDEILYLHL